MLHPQDIAYPCTLVQPAIKHVHLLTYLTDERVDHVHVLWAQCSTHFVMDRLWKAFLTGLGHFLAVLNLSNCMIYKTDLANIKPTLLAIVCFKIQCMLCYF
jgi:uncharacterized membrane protein YcfT